MSSAGKDSGIWGDLPARVASALVMLLVGGVAIWQGGVLFHELVVVICAGMIWELTRMLNGGDGRSAIVVAAIAAAALLATYVLPGQAIGPVLAAVGFVGAGQAKKYRLVYGAYAIGLMFACYGLIVLRDVRGAYWLLWLVSVVVATDIAGYFAGRMIGGPKFWPRVSPKKTWSGTAAGWVGAAVVGAVFAINTEATAQLVGVSVALSMASQMGDIGESATRHRGNYGRHSRFMPTNTRVDNSCTRLLNLFT